METSKRFLAMLLALAMALALALPAFAEGETPPAVMEAQEEMTAQEAENQGVNWDNFWITKQPQSQRIRIWEEYTVSVEVYAPPGVEVEYRWWGYPGGLGSYISHFKGATEPVYTSTYLADKNFFELIIVLLFGDIGGTAYCEIIGYEKDEDGNVISQKRLASDFARITLKGVDNVLVTLLQLLTVYPVVSIALGLYAGIFTFLGLGLILMPYYTVGFYMMLIGVRFFT